ncbi:hypothetical protein [Gracilinema caldarium]|uniref:hypothetical protein n=1 Tax=Gracilinema caldarium TaxID=215591 RepID=UPI0026EF7C0A|nr:hypothetical protein [Gracilinema caldarium]
MKKMCISKSMLVMSSAALLAISLYAASLLSCGYSGFLSQTIEQGLRYSYDAGAPSPGFDHLMSPGAPERGSSAEGAILVQGTKPVRGLPGFGRNAIPGLAGTYSIRSSDGNRSFAIPVWASQEQLYFKSPIWNKTTALPKDVSRAWIQIIREESFIPAYTLQPIEYNSNQARIRALELAFPGPQASQWTLLVLELADTAEAQSLYDQFYKKLTERFIYFLGTARRVEDISLPAVVVW